MIFAGITGYVLKTWGDACNPCGICSGVWCRRYNPILHADRSINIGATFAPVPMWGLGLHSADPTATPGSLVDGYCFVSLVNTVFTETGSIYTPNPTIVPGFSGQQTGSWSPDTFPRDGSGRTIYPPVTPVPFDWHIGLNGTPTFTISSGAGALLDNLVRPYPYPTPFVTQVGGAASGAEFGKDYFGSDQVAYVLQVGGGVFKVTFSNCIQLNPDVDYISQGSTALTPTVYATQEIRGTVQYYFGTLKDNDGQTFYLGTPPAGTVTSVKLWLDTGTTTVKIGQSTFGPISDIVTAIPVATTPITRTFTFNTGGTASLYLLQTDSSTDAVGLHFTVYYAPYYAPFDCVYPALIDISNPITATDVSVICPTSSGYQWQNFDCVPAWPGSLSVTVSGGDQQSGLTQVSPGVIGTAPSYWDPTQPVSSQHGECYEIALGIPWDWITYWHVTEGAADHRYLT